MNRRRGAKQPAPLRFAEQLGDHTTIEYRVEEVRYSGASPFQQIDVLELPRLGTALFLDGLIQTCQADEFLYHESLVHPAMACHGAPRRVLVAGGGDGGALREVLRHPSVELAVLAELDKAVVDASRDQMPWMSDGAFDDERTKLVFGDARKELEASPNRFDAVILDLTEPVAEGISARLFTREFYELVAHALGHGGVMVAQTANAAPGHGGLLADVLATMGEVVDHTAPVLCPVPSFQGIWSFALGSFGANPVAMDAAAWADRLGPVSDGLRYLTPRRLATAVEAPPYLQSTLAEGTVRTDASPFVWTE